MKQTISHFLFPIIASAIWIVVASTAHAQPKGWPCDYGYRPGNTWFYRSTSFQGRIYSESVIRDSVGANGEYWVYFRSPTLQFDCWYRINNNCEFDLFYNPSWSHYQHWYVPQLDSGDSWVVDTLSDSTLPLVFHSARIYDVYNVNVFGKNARSWEVVYYLNDEFGESWEHSQVWSERIGIIRKRSHPGGFDEIVGAIIDGVSYGNTSGLNDGEADEAKRIAIYPLPASTSARLLIPSHGEHAAVIETYDMLGRQVRRERLEGLADGVTTTLLDVSGLAPGAYIVAVEIDGVRSTTPLVIAR